MLTSADGLWAARAARLRALFVRLRPALAARVDLSGVVQQTLLDAHLAGDGCPADSRGGGAWLRRAFANNLTDEVRRHRAQARDPAREEPLADLAADAPTPSRLAVRAEHRERAAAALAALPDDQRRAVELRYLHGLPVAAIADALGRSRPATAGLIHRGLVALRAVADT